MSTRAPHGAILMAFVSVVGFGLTSCSSDNSGNGATRFSSGLSEGQQLNSLANSDAQKLCEATAAYAASQVPRDVTCRLSGLAASQAVAGGQLVATDSDLRQVCRNAYNSCASQLLPGDAGADASAPQSGMQDSGETAQMDAEPNDAGSVEASTSTASQDAGATACGQPPPSCTATVGDYEACVNDETNAFRSIPTCDAVTIAMFQQDSGDAGITFVQAPSSCTTLDQKCPGMKH